MRKNHHARILAIRSCYICRYISTLFLSTILNIHTFSSSAEDHPRLKDQSERLVLLPFGFARIYEVSHKLVVYSVPVTIEY